ncbi:MAG: ice-binding family protein [Bacteroidales bacterium]
MKTKRFWITPIAVFSIAAILGGCFEDNYVPIGSVCPMVISTDPADLDTEVPLNQIVTATFNEQMNPATITPESFIFESGTTLAGALSYDGNNATLSFEPTNSLRVSTTYTATIKSTVKDLLGNALQEDYVWTFSTGTLPESPEGIDLKTVARFGIISGLGVSNNAGNSEIHNLDVGIYPGARSSITGFPPAIVVNGAIYASDDIAPPGVAAMLLQAKNDLTEAYLAAEGATDPAPATVSGDQGGKTLAPGIYKSTSTLLIQNGDLTLDAQGDANASWIFQIASGFTTVGGGPYPSPSGGNVILAGGAQADNIIWQVGSSVTIGDYTSFKGNVLALETITMGAYSQADGRMLARNGSVTMTSTNIINKP